MSTSSPFRILNIRLFIAFRVFFNARFYYPVFTILFLDYGLTIEQFSILNTVWAITIVCAEVPSGALADLLGRKRLLVLTSLLMIVELSVIAFVPITSMTIIFWAFLVNRVLSGLAEAMASGADEAIAYDSLIAEGNPAHWPRVLSVQMRAKAMAGVISTTLGAMVYDPSMVNGFLSLVGFDSDLSQQTTMRFPVYLTLVLALLAFWTTLRMREENEAAEPRPHVTLATIWQAGLITLKAGRWILQTPLALAVILFGMTYDHVLRLTITLTSQYFRQISLPDASFGAIMAALTLLGLVVPKLAEFMVDRFSPAQNCGWLALLTIVTLLGLTGFIPYLGIIPIAMVMIGLMLTAFFTSHYLNEITSSEQRATVLSFKGLAFNLAYGIIGLLFAWLIIYLRADLSGAHPDWSSQLIENQAFKDSFLWMPGYFLVLGAAIALYSARILNKTKASK
ncbi:MAG: MFS transporter [Desulfofustis sp.]|nr:MFS transporter [Desulfofustis sp.]